MAKAVKQTATGPEQIVLAIDIGGSHVKILTSAGGTERRDDSGPDLTPQQMIDKVKKLAEGLSYDVISMGYPGPVRRNKPVLDPMNLGKGWAGFDFAAMVAVQLASQGQGQPGLADGDQQHRDPKHGYMLPPSWLGHTGPPGEGT